MKRHLIYIFLFILINSTIIIKSENNRETPIVKAVRKTGPAVVNISTEKIIKTHPFYTFNDEFFNKFFGDFSDFFPQENYKQQTLGSGLIISKDGYILTNKHIIIRASEIKVTLTNKNEYKGKLVGADPNLDIAVIKIDADNLPTAQLGKSDDLMIGETVITIGNPFGLQNTVTTGVISATGRSIKVREKTYTGLLQTDASVNPGNSGGPLLNINGEVIGINTAIYEGAEGIGFAIPIDKAKIILNRLISGKEINMSYLGIRIQPLTQDLALHLNYPLNYGILVSDVDEGSPAENGSIKSGDIITTIQGQNIYTVDDYNSVLSSITIGERVEITYYRKGIQKTTTLKAIEFPTNSILELAEKWLGIRVSEIDNTNLRKYNLFAKNGVVITKVNKRSLFAINGIEEGDVIIQFGVNEINNIKDFKDSIIKNYGKTSILIMIRRGREIYRGTIEG